MNEIKRGKTNNVDWIIFNEHIYGIGVQYNGYVNCNPAGKSLQTNRILAYKDWLLILAWTMEDLKYKIEKTIEASTGKSCKIDAEEDYKLQTLEKDYFT